MAALESTPTLRSAETVFDELGAKYEAGFSGSSAQINSIQWLLAQLEAHKPAKFIDVGCGTGRPVCFEIANAGHDVLGIDISQEMVNLARKNVPNARFEKTDVARYQAVPSSFDAVTVYLSLIADISQSQLKQYIQQFYDWLKSGGVMVFATVPESADNARITWLGNSMVVSGFGEHEYLDLLKNVGFEIVYHEMIQFMPNARALDLPLDDVGEELHMYIYARKQ